MIRRRAAGAIRDDVRIPELLALLVGASQASRSAGGDPAVQARILAVVLDGLRSGSPQDGTARPTS